MGDGIEDEDLERLNAQLLERRQRVEIVPAPRVSTAAELAGERLFGMRPDLRGLKVVSGGLGQVKVFGQVLAEGIEDLRERCLARGIRPSGDVGAALYAWEPEWGWEEFQAAVANPAVRLLLLTGDRGAGKTCLAARAVMMAPVRGGVVPLITRDVKAGEAVAHPYDDDRRALARRLAAASVVAFDDVGRDPLSDAQRHALCTLWGDRAEQRLRSVVTTNLTLPQFVQTFLDGQRGRLTDRLSGQAFAVVQVDGPSRRRGVR